MTESRERQRKAREVPEALKRLIETRAPHAGNRTECHKPGSHFLADQLVGDIGTLLGLSDGIGQGALQLRLWELLLISLLQQVLQFP